MVVDGCVVTTTGISASMPLMLTLIEAIGGRAAAEKVAADLGVGRWGAGHASGAFQLTRPFVTTVLLNRLPFWKRETFGIELRTGMDEVSLVLVADAWSRTYRSRVLTFAGSAIVTAGGIRVLPDGNDGGHAGARSVPAFDDRPPAAALDGALGAIAGRYGPRTADLVAMQLEYDWRDQGRDRAGG